MGKAKMAALGYLGPIAMIALLTACGEQSPPSAVTTAEAASFSKELGTYWVNVTASDEHSTPDGPVVNRVYYGQQFTIYEKRGDWYRTVEDGFVPRWTKASDLSATKPPEKPAYPGPPETQDDRIAPNAFPKPGEYGLTRRDVDTLRKGAMMVLRKRPDCSQITIGDKSVNKPNTYYVTCRVNGSVENVFFTPAEVAAS